MEQVTMPQLGETVVEGTVTRWLKAEGDEVALDEPLFEVSTDKIDTEVPAAHAGVLRAVLVPEGDTVPVGTVLALIGGATEEAPDPEPTRPRPPRRCSRPRRPRPRSARRCDRGSGGS